MSNIDAFVSELHSMFGGIDKQVIKQIYLSCGKDQEQTIDKLLSMGPVETPKPIPLPAPAPVPVHIPVPIPVTPSPPTFNMPISFPPHPQDSFTIPVPSSFTIIPPLPAPTVNEDAVEQKRLENLKQELAAEYQRLSEKQKQSLEAEKRLADLRMLIADQQESLSKEQANLFEEKRKFEATKKALEGHLSATIATMKEEVRKQEEERQRLEAEKREVEERERQEKKAQRRFQKEARKAEEMRSRTEELIGIEQAKKEMEAVLIEKQAEFQQVMQDKDNQIKDLQKEVQILVLELEAAKKKSRDIVVDTLSEKVSNLLDSVKHELLVTISKGINPAESE